MSIILFFKKINNFFLEIFFIITSLIPGLILYFLKDYNKYYNFILLFLIFIILFYIILFFLINKNNEKYLYEINIKQNNESFLIYAIYYIFMLLELNIIQFFIINLITIIFIYSFKYYYNIFLSLINFKHYRIENNGKIYILISNKNLSNKNTIINVININNYIILEI